MRFRILMILLLFAILISATGCSRTGKNGNQIGNINFRTGTEGLVMRLDPNTPPPRIYDFQDLNFVVEVQNRGAYDLNSLGFNRIYISGFDRSVIVNKEGMSIDEGLPVDGKQIPELNGKNQFGYGASSILTFNGAVASGLRNQFPADILFTVCYEYKTIAQAPVCIDPDPYTISSIPKVCTPKSVSLGSQGAPIEVSQILVQPSTQKTRFAIDIRNANNGDPFTPESESYNRCNPNNPNGLDYNEIDYVLLENVEISGTRLSCEPLVDGKYVRLVNGRARIFCDYTVQRSGVATVPLTVELRYGYRQSVQRRVLIIPEDP